MASDFATTAVVLAGGTSRRFGSDKLSARWGRTTLLGHVVAELPPAWSVIVVGPHRVLTRTVSFVSEEPPGSGPAAGLLTGLRAARVADRVVTMPGDAPYAPMAAVALAYALAEAEAVVAAGPDPHPLHLGLCGDALAEARGLDPASWANRSARALLGRLAPKPVDVPARWLIDVDVPADLTAARQRD